MSARSPGAPSSSNGSATPSDWMRMLWQFLVLDEVGGITMSKPTLWQIFYMLAIAPTSDWDGWSVVIQDPQVSTFDARFNALALENGVDNGE